MNRHPLILALASALLLALAPLGVNGQQTENTKAGLRGVVIDSESALPLEGAIVTLDPSPAGIVASGEPGLSGFLNSARQAATGEDGVYRFDGLAIGKYHLRVA